MIINNLTMKRTAIGLSLIGAVACTGIVAVAGVPLPDVIYVGSITSNGQPVTATDDVRVLARVDGVTEPIGAYRMGQSPMADDNYVLRLRLESEADGAPQGNDVARVGQTANIFIKVARQAELLVQSVVIPATGTVVSLNLDACFKDTDLNSTGTTELADHVVLQGCFTGPEQGPISQPCEASDLDCDDDVDLRDWAQLQNGFE